MPTKTEVIEKCRNILKRLKSELYVDGILNDELFQEAFDTFYLIKENDLVVLAPYVYALLDHEDEIIRKEAVALLGFTTRLHVPEFRDKAYEIFLNDIDDSVRATALAAWVNYFYESDNKKVLKILYDILLDNNQHCYVRTNAYTGIYTTISDLFTARTSINTTPMIKSETVEEFNKHVDWHGLEDIMRKYAPEALEKTKG